MDTEMEKNETSPEDEKKELLNLRKIARRNKATALGLAVLLATSNMILTGCETRQFNKKSRAAILQRLKEEENSDWDTDFIGGGGDVGYYRYSGRPTVKEGGTVFWSAGPGTYHTGGYGVIRGGSAG